MSKLELVRIAEHRRTPNGTKVPMGLYRCECGTEKLINVYNVRRGRQVSCGCVQKANRTTHGMWGTTTYKRWEDMKGRCNPNANRADRYHDRGIGCAPEWERFEAFYADMGECPEGHELDRIDNNQSYSKGNCRWASRSLNMRNRTETNRKSRGRYQNILWNEKLQKWGVRVAHHGKNKHIGLYATEDEALVAYNAFARQHGYPERG